MQSVVKWTASENEKSTLELIENCMLGVFLVRAVRVTTQATATLTNPVAASAQSELFLKTFALGWGRFWRRSVFNKVDMIAILGAAISTIIVEVILNRKHSAVITMFYFMRFAAGCGRSCCVHVLTVPGTSECCGSSVLCETSGSSV